MVTGDMSYGDLRQLASTLGGLSTDTSNLGAFRKGEVVSVQAGTPDTCTITLSGDSTPISGVFFLDSYIPTPGDVVILAKQSGSLLILGSVNPDTSVVYTPPSDLDTYVIKPSDTSKANNTSEAADPHLALAVAANSSYVLDGLIVTSNSGGDGNLKCGIYGPTGATGWWHAIMPSTGPTTDPSEVRTVATALGATRAYGHAAPTNEYGLPVSAVIVTGGTAGDVTFTWAQQTSNATATLVKSNSYLHLRKVS